MMKTSFGKILIGAAIVAGVVVGCTKQTSDYIAMNDDALGKTLLQLIEENKDLSSFAGYLKTTGYDKALSSSKTYTVYAPSNSAFATVDPAILADPAKLKLLIGNHISSQRVPANGSLSGNRIAMLNGKYLNTAGKKIDDANITTADMFAGNGLLQLVDAVIPARLNCWEFMTTAEAPTSQSAFMQKLFGNVFDTTNAVVIGVDPNTGAPIYQPGTDSVYTNVFWNRIYDLRNESKQFTYFMVTNTAWDAEQTKYKGFFETTTVDSTNKITGWNVVKEFAVDTVYQPGTIPDTILSKAGIKVGIDKSAIVKTVKTSNGIVYIMSKLDVRPADKFLPILIQAENYTSTSVNRRSNTYFRDRKDSITGINFSDVLVTGHGVALFNMRYEINEMPKIKYKAYWKALCDFQAVTFQQKLGIGDATSAILPYITVNVRDYKEVLLGEFTNTRYWPKYNVFLTAANSTTAAANPLVCDYIKLVPSF
ncbi:MAG TPA: fasciclin domain-containing protein [Phnomibacter sp.]|nr:fasciclin domain-containing protein [Phnomibacter sp.]